MLAIREASVTVEHRFTGTNSSEAVKLSITCQGLSPDARLSLYAEGLSKL
jgi:hypothetical protein